VAIMLDRRVDPGQEVTFSENGAPLEDALKRLADHLGLGVCYVGEAAYVGPVKTTTILPTLAALKNRETNKLRRPLAATQPWSWEDLATPRELIQQLAAEAGVAIQGLEQTPHDLWPATSLPALTFAERLSLVLAGFDLSFALSADGKAIRLIPTPAEVNIDRSFAKSVSPTDLAKLKTKFPNVSFRRTGARLVAAGLLEDLQRLEQVLEGRQVERRSDRPGKPTDPSMNRYTLEVENRVGAILKAIAARAELNLEVDPRATTKLAESVSLQVENVTLEELLTKTLAPAGLTFRISGATLEIRPAEQN
jgi:hypothetical protein